MRSDTQMSLISGIIPIEPLIKAQAEKVKPMLLFDEQSVSGLSPEVMRMQVESIKKTLQDIIARIEQCTTEEKANLQDAMGTLLMFAIACGDKVLAMKLIENGANLNIKTPEGKDALFFAVINGQDEIQQALIKQGAQKDAVFAVANNFSELQTFKRPQIGFLTEFIHAHKNPDEPLIPLEAYYLATRFGHTIGLSVKVPQAEGGNIELEVRGNSAERSLRWLHEYVGKYSQSEALEGTPEKALFEKIDATLKRSASLLQRNSPIYSPEAAKTLCDDYQKGEMIYIASGFRTPPHSVGIALYGRHLVYCNRGREIDGTELDQDRTRIYEIPEGFEITPEFLKSIMNMNNETPEDLKAALKDIMTEENLVASLPTKGQERGNCSFANSKATVEPMMLLLQNDKKDSENLKKIVAQHVEDNRREYKNFSRYIREQEIELAVQMAPMAQSEEMKSFYVNLIKGIIKEHSGTHSTTQSRSEDKAEQEVERVIKLVDSLPEELNRIIRATLPMAIQKKLTTDGGTILTELSTTVQKQMEILKEEAERIKALGGEFANDDRIEAILEVCNKPALTCKDVERLKNSLHEISTEIRFSDTPDPALLSLRDTIAPLITSIENQLSQKAVTDSSPKIDSMPQTDSTPTPPSSLTVGFKSQSSSGPKLSEIATRPQETQEITPKPTPNRIKVGN